jgi:hypothetical protein
MVEDELFRDLKGTPCLNPNCKAEDSVLGKMVGVRQLDMSEEQVVGSVFEASCISSNKLEPSG